MPRHIVEHGSSPPWPHPVPVQPVKPLGTSRGLLLQTGGAHAIGVLVLVDGSTCRPMAHRNAAISRAIAALTMGAFLPAAVMRRWRAQSRVCAFQAISRTGFGRLSSRTRMVSVTLAGWR